MAINASVTSIGVLTPDGEPARFSLSIIGIDAKEFYTVPGGSRRVHESFKLEKLDGYVSSLFFITQLGEEYLAPPRFRKHSVMAMPLPPMPEYSPPPSVPTRKRKSGRKSL